MSRRSLSLRVDEVKCPSYSWAGTACIGADDRLSICLRARSGQHGFEGSRQPVGAE